MNKLSERIRNLRQEKGYSQQALADALGTSKSSINMYERGEREPGVPMLIQMSNFFRVDLDYLVGNSDERGLVSIAKPLEDLPEDVAALNVLLSKIGEHIIKTEDGYFMGEAGAISEDDIQFLLNTAADSLRPAVNILIKRAEMEMKQ